MSSFLLRERRPQSRTKNDHIELLSLLDKCSQIIKDDRLMLRQQIKEGCQELLAVFSAHRKKSDLHLLQLELRKYLNKVKGKHQAQVQQTIFKPVSKENNQQAYLAHYNRIEQRQLESTPKQMVKKSSQSVMKKHLSPPMRSPQFKPNKSPNNTGKKNPPIQQTQQSLTVMRQEFSPRFNTNKAEIPEADLSEFLNQKEIENSRTQLEMFEQKINEYSKGHTNGLWASHQQSPIGSTNAGHRKNDTIFSQLQGTNLQETNFETFSQNRQDAKFNCVLASFQNFGQQISEFRREEQTQQSSRTNVLRDSTNHKQHTTNVEEVADWNDQNDFETQFQASQSVILNSNVKFQETTTNEYHPPQEVKQCKVALDFRTVSEVQKKDDYVVSDYKGSHIASDLKSSNEYKMDMRFGFEYSKPVELSQSNQRPSTSYMQSAISSLATSYQLDQKLKTGFNRTDEFAEYRGNQNLENDCKTFTLPSASEYPKQPFPSEQNQEIPQISVDDIMAKYAYLFTAPDFLQQCKTSIQMPESSFNQHILAQPIQENQCNSFNQTSGSHYSHVLQENQLVTSIPTEQRQDDGTNWNFMVPCHSVVCNGNSTNNWDVEWTKWQQLLQGIESFTAEQVFDEIFSENSLNRISRAFFRFKMESLLQSINCAPVSFDDLFITIDTKQDGFIDVNEMGECLQNLCPVDQNHNMRIIFSVLDEGRRGYFTKDDLDDFLARIQTQCDVQDDINLLELSTMFFCECDLFQSQTFTYWEFYLKKTTESCQRVTQVLLDYLDQLEQLANE